jgi:predicted nuclease of predicted toxin-antitoxin system
MRFLLDESTDARLASFLRSQGHDVALISVDHPASISDREVVEIAHREQRILITDDRDFGELVYSRGHPHAGVIYLRLGNVAGLNAKSERLQHVIEEYADRLDCFLVVTQHRVRVRA